MLNAGLHIENGLFTVISDQEPSVVKMKGHTKTIPSTSENLPSYILVIDYDIALCKAD